MRKPLLVLFAGVLLLTSPPASAQDVPPQLTKVLEAIECVKKERKSGWTFERVPPISSAENVLIQMWVSGGRRVKVSILPHLSEAAAIDAIRRFVSAGASKQLQGLGDEAYSWGYGDEIALRKGSVTVYVSAISDIDTLLPMIDVAESAELRRVEQVALNKNFAKLMSDILANPSAACTRTLYQRL